jgi:hypothetical protein
VPIGDDIAKIRARKDLDEDSKRRHVYDVKVRAHLDAIHGDSLIGRTFTHKGRQFRINEAQTTAEGGLFLDVTFTAPPAEPVTHQITITNPPVLPHVPTGDERKDLIQTISEMLEAIP